MDYKFRIQQIQAQDRADAPGAVRYLLRSAPEMIAAAAGVKWQDFLNTVELQALVRPGAPSERVRVREAGRAGGLCHGTMLRPGPRDECRGILRSLVVRPTCSNHTLVMMVPA